MIQGVHAETVIFSPYEAVRPRLLALGWPWYGNAAQLGGRDVQLRSSRPRSFRLHIVDTRSTGKAVACQLELHDVERRFTPLIKADLVFGPSGGNTKVSLKGSAVRDLASPSGMQSAMARGLANEYVRDLLEQIARHLEGGPAAMHNGSAAAALG